MIAAGWQDPSKWSPSLRWLINSAITGGSVLLCLLVLPARLPGMELLGVAPNWLLIWVVAWSLKRTIWEGAIAGIALGLIQDGMTATEPTHVLSLAVVGFLTARIQKQRYIQEDFVSVALIVFGMAVLAETVTAIQFSLDNLDWVVQLTSRDPSFLETSNQFAQRTLPEIWLYHQRVALSSAILSSLWAPAVYYPLKRWWEQFNPVEPV